MAYESNTDYQQPQTMTKELVEELCGPHMDSYFGREDIQADILREAVETMMPVVAAADRIRPYVVHTSLDEAPLISQATGNRVLLKREDLQPVRSFKIRGAASRMTQLSEEEKQGGVMTVSAGNHAQGVASIAQQMGIPATIIMPVTTPQVKVEAVRSFGAEVLLGGNNYSEAMEFCADVRKETGATFIHAFGDRAVIDGQATIGLEILEDAPYASHVFVPIGGGGLAAGVGTAIKSVRPDIKIIGVQYDQSDAMAQSIELGELTTLNTVGGFSDGTAVAAVSPETFRLVGENVDEIIRVSEDDIVLATSDFYAETRSFLEPAGALALAGIQKYSSEQNVHNQTMVAICSGGNIAPEKIAFTIERAAFLEGKRALLSIRIPEQPGALRTLCREVLGEHNITEFRYAYNEAGLAEILLGVSLADSTDKSRLLTQLNVANYYFKDHSLDRLAQEHAAHMVGGPTRVPEEREASFHVTFPEKPGALLKFLDTIGDEWNITRFNYRGTSSDTGNVLIGFSVTDDGDRQRLTEKLLHTDYHTEHVKTGELQQFIGKRMLSVA